MASTSPVSAIDLDILLYIQQAETAANNPTRARDKSIIFSSESKESMYIARIIATEPKRNINIAERETLYFWGLWTAFRSVEYAMGTQARKKNSMNQLGELKEAYDTAAIDATHKDTRVPIHSHRSLFDERHLHGIRFDNFRSVSKINRIKSENAERNGHPGTNAAMRDVKTKNSRPRPRRAPMAWAIEAWTVQTDVLGLVSVFNLTGEDLKYLTKHWTQTSKEQWAGWMATYLSLPPTSILEHRCMLLGASSLRRSKTIQLRILDGYSWLTTTWPAELAPIRWWITIN